MHNSYFATCQKLINQPFTETLNVEIKNWLDLTTQKDKAKVVKACIALRNFNGGFLVFGFDDKEKRGIRNEKNIEKIYDKDTIQGLISKHSSHPFEIFLEYPALNGQKHPIIVIPKGVKSPVFVVKPIIEKDKTYLEHDRCYCRTLNANNFPSTSVAGPKDFAEMVDICFKNKEADIGDFFRRHLSAIRDELVGISETERIDQGFTRCEEVLQEMETNAFENGGLELACEIDGETTFTPKININFLNLINSSNPDTGWKLWGMASKKTSHENYYVKDQAWESYRYYPNEHGHVDFVRIEPSFLYTYQQYYEDIDTSIKGRCLDFSNTITTVKKAFFVSIALAKRFTYIPETTFLKISFRWTGLKNRELANLSPPRRAWSKRVAVQPVFQKTVEVPLDLPDRAIVDYAQKIVDPFLALFEGFVVERDVFESIGSEFN